MILLITLRNVDEKSLTLASIGRARHDIKAQDSARVDLQPSRSLHILPPLRPSISYLSLFHNMFSITTHPNTARSPTAVTDDPVDWGFWLVSEEDEEAPDSYV